jgi:hypothetical protein
MSYFLSRLVISTSNTVDFDNVGITNPSALRRRVKFPIRVMRGEDLKEDLSNIDRAWKFSLIPIKDTWTGKSKFFPQKEEFGFVEFMKAICDEQRMVLSEVSHYRKAASVDWGNLLGFEDNVESFKEEPVPEPKTPFKRDIGNFKDFAKKCFQRAKGFKKYAFEKVFELEEEVEIQFSELLKYTYAAGEHAKILVNMADKKIRFQVQKTQEEFEYLIARAKRLADDVYTFVDGLAKLLGNVEFSYMLFAALAGMVIIEVYNNFENVGHPGKNDVSVSISVEFEEVNLKSLGEADDAESTEAAVAQMFSTTNDVRFKRVQDSVERRFQERGIESNVFIKRTGAVIEEIFDLSDASSVEDAIQNTTDRIDLKVMGHKDVPAVAAIYDVDVTENQLRANRLHQRRKKKMGDVLKLHAEPEPEKEKETLLSQVSSTLKSFFSRICDSAAFQWIMMVVGGSTLAYGICWGLDTIIRRILMAVYTFDEPEPDENQFDIDALSSYVEAQSMPKGKQRKIQRRLPHLQKGKEQAKLAEGQSYGDNFASVVKKVQDNNRYVDLLSRDGRSIRTGVLFINNVQFVIPSHAMRAINWYKMEVEGIDGTLSFCIDRTEVEVRDLSGSRDLICVTKK